MKRVVMVASDCEIDRRITQEAQSLQREGFHVILISSCSREIYPRFEITDGLRIEWFVPIPLAFVDRCVISILRLRHIRFSRLFNRVPRNKPVIGGVSEQPNLVISGLDSLILSLIPRLNGLSFHERSLVERIVFYRPDVIHIHDLPQLRAGVHASRRLQVPLIFDAHEMYTEIGGLSRLEKTRFKLIERRYIKECDSVVTVNPYLAKEMSRRYSITEPHVILNASPAVPNARVSDRLRQHLDLGEEDRIAIYQGWITKSRGLENTIEGLVFTDRRLHLVFIGYGEYAHFLEKLSRQLKVADRVHFVPAVPQMELLEWSSSADVGIIPYPDSDFNHRYCSPNKLFEFIQARIPIVANDSPYLRDVIVGNRIGSVVSINEPRLFGAAIEELAFSSPQAKRDLQRALNAAAEGINWEIEEKTLLSLYLDLKQRRSD